MKKQIKKGQPTSLVDVVKKRKTQTQTQTRPREYLTRDPPLSAMRRSFATKSLSREEPPFLFHKAPLRSDPRYVLR